MIGIDKARSVAYRRLLPRRRSEALGNAVVEYSISRSDAEKRDFQLAEFNEMWAMALNTPFYKRWAQIHGLPAAVSSLEQLVEFPELTKGDIIENFDLIDFTNGKGPYVKTGGSTGAPIRLPRSSIEDSDTYARAYLGKVNAGLLPGDRYVHLWGHSFLFGTGRTRFVRMAVRKAKDWAAGGVRLSAYDYSRSSVQRQAHIIRKKDPKYIIGYVSAVARVARFVTNNRDSGPNFPSLEAVIVTAETIAREDRRVIEEGYGVPCLVEYGCAEAGVLAHSSLGDAQLSTYWRSVILSSRDDGRVRVTTISPRGFPLVNYALNDRLANVDTHASILRFDHVEGRAQDVFRLELRDGARVEIGARFVVHALKMFREVATVQYAQTDNGINVYVTLDGKVAIDNLRDRLVSDLRAHFGDINAEQVRVSQLVSPVPSVSGKLTIQVDEKSASSLVVAYSKSG